MKNLKLSLMMLLLMIVAVSCQKSLSLTSLSGTDASNGTKKAESVQTYYVSNDGNNNNDGLSTSTPWKTITYAAGKDANNNQRIAPGSVVKLMSRGGAFVWPSPAGAVAGIGCSGTAAAWITFKANDGDHPVISGAGDIFNCIYISGSYIIFDGIEVIGNNANLSLSAAQNAEVQYRANHNIPAIDYAKYVTNGISINGSNHHVTIQHCKVHDFPGAGIGSAESDWVTIQNNEVYNCGLFTFYGVSGIGTKGLFNFGTDTTQYQMVIRNNITHDNKSQVTYLYKPEGVTSDGNGIIIDINNGSVNADGSINYSSVPYKGKTRIENNISYNNGGAGINMVGAHKIYAVNNTTYNNGLVNNNGQTYGYPEFSSYECYDLVLWNNIMYASSKSGARCNNSTKPVSASGAITATGNIVYNYNLMYVGAVNVPDAHIRTTDPLFVNKSIYDFQLTSSSPAVNTGYGGSPYYSYTDFLGVARPKNGQNYVDRGAYESF